MRLWWHRIFIYLSENTVYWWKILSLVVLAPFLISILYGFAKLFINIGIIFSTWLNVSMHPLFFIFFLGIVLILLPAFVIIINSKLVSRQHKRKRRHYFFCFFVLLTFLFLSWLIIHALMQLEFFCHDCQNSLRDWLFTLLASIVLYCVAVTLLHALGIKYKAVNNWHQKIEAHFFKFIKENKKIYLKPKIIISFLLILIILLFTLLLAAYWVDNSSVPRIKPPQCEAGDINCFSLSPDEQNTTDSKSIQLEAEANIIRNKWFWIFGFIALGLTVWGRITAHQQTNQIKEQIKLTYDGIIQTGEQIELTRQANAGERMQEAFKNIKDSSMGIRMAGIQILSQIANDNKIPVPILTILLSFMHIPYLTDEQKEKKEEKEKSIVSVENNFSLIDILSPEYLMPGDIQEAANSISKIYKSVYEYNADRRVELENKAISLPLYFWQNKKKDIVAFPNINLKGEKMEKAYLVGANLVKANLESAILTSANLENASLEYANLRAADFVWANLTRANLEGVISEGAKFNEANLSGANLAKANLENAILMSANFENANLEYAYLGGADFSGANLTHANLEIVFNITKEQILSAIWGIDEKGIGEPPALPNKLMKDDSIKEWCRNPHYSPRDDSDRFNLPNAN